MGWEDLTWEHLTAAGTLVALVLSVYNFATQRLAVRKASLSARLERYVPQPIGSDDVERWRSLAPAFTRLVVTNHGPADATSVRISIEGDSELLAAEPTEDAVSVPILHDGEDYHLEVIVPMGTDYPAFADLEWRDRRRRAQQRRVWLSIRQVI